jgi:hypothetical protein
MSENKVVRLRVESVSADFTPYKQYGITYYPEGLYVELPVLAAHIIEKDVDKETGCLTVGLNGLIDICAQINFAYFGGLDTFRNKQTNTNRK